MEGMRLILNDGSTIENGRAGLADGFLWLHFPGFTMQETAAIVFDPEKTAVVVFQYGQMEDEHTGYTTCTILTERDGETSACMTRR